jgi:hypothetical protein
MSRKAEQETIQTGLSNLAASLSEDKPSASETLKLELLILEVIE